MSFAIAAIPASKFVDITPSVISGGGNALSMIGLMLDDGTRVETGVVRSFPTALDVADYFGSTSQEYADAVVYFNGYRNGSNTPQGLLIAQYPTANVGAYLRGGDVSATKLTTLQAFGGVLVVTINGTVETSSTISLAGAVSFSSAAQILTTGLGVAGAVEASVTASIGASFTGSGTGTSLVASAVTGTITVGDTITGTGVPGSTTITAFNSGTLGGAGTYTTSGATTSSGATIVAASDVLYVSTVASGTVAIGQQLVGSGVATTTFITENLPGTGVWQLTTTQHVVPEAMTLEAPTVTYDSLWGGFVIASPTAGIASTIGFASSPSAAFAGHLGLTQATGAILSQGAAAADPATFMNNLIQTSEDWATFWTNFDPDNSGNANKVAFADWNNGQGDKFLYAAWDTDITPTESNAATTSLGYTLKQAGTSGTACIYQPVGPNLHLAAFLAGYVASLNFSEHEGRANAAYEGQDGLTASVTNQTVSDNLDANGYSYYAAAATRSQDFDFFYNGQVSGPFQWIDSYVNQIQFNAALQQALMNLLTQVRRIPYNAAGYGLIRAALLDPINAAINFGTITQGVPLSALQAAEVNQRSGLKIDTILSTLGWYLLIQPATAQVRQARQSPVMTLWYTDGQSVQQINLASILIQ